MAWRGMRFRGVLMAVCVLGITFAGCARRVPDTAVLAKERAETIVREQHAMRALLEELKAAVEEQQRTLQALRADSRAQQGEVTERLNQLQIEFESQAELIDQWQAQLWEQATRPAVQLADTTDTLDALFGTMTAPADTLVPVDPQAQALYDQSYRAFSQGNYDAAVSRFQEFLGRYPDHPSADMGQYWLAESYYALGDLGRAVDEYLRLTHLYPESHRLAAATLKVGYVHLREGKLDRAARYFQTVLENFPNSPEADLARDRLNQMR